MIPGSKQVKLARLGKARKALCTKLPVVERITGQVPNRQLIIKEYVLPWTPFYGEETKLKVVKGDLFMNNATKLKVNRTLGYREEFENQFVISKFTETCTFCLQTTGRMHARKSAACSRRRFRMGPTNNFFKDDSAQPKSNEKKRKLDFGNDNLPADKIIRSV